MANDWNGGGGRRRQPSNVPSGRCGFCLRRRWIRSAIRRRLVVPARRRLVVFQLRLAGGAR